MNRRSSVDFCSDLDNHIARIHKGTMAFECDTCDRSYASQTGLQNHLKLKHHKEALPTFRCNLCPKTKKTIQHPVPL